MENFDTSTFRALIPGLFVDNEKIQRLTLKNIRARCEENLEANDTYSRKLIELCEMTEKGKKTIYDIHDFIMPVRNNNKIVCTYNKIDLIFGNDRKIDIKMTSDSILSLEYKPNKGIMLQESWSQIPKVSILSTSSALYKGQIFEIPESRIEVLTSSRSKILFVKINEDEMEISKEIKVAEFEDFSINAKKTNGVWFFEGNFHRYLHNALSLSTCQSSPWLLLAQGRNSLLSYTIRAGEKLLEISI